MANLHRHTCLTESFESSTARFRRYFSATAVDECVTVALRPHVMLPDIGTEVMLRRDVIVTLHAGPAYAVSWMPSDLGPFPRLTGEVRLVDDPPEHSRLVLFGDTPREGVPPTSRIGHRINQAIARELLMHLARQIA
jgi:hypothetical protein